MSISSALKARREALRNREDGFTLIELLVVVIIIGILAAIAIPIYLGVQNSAKDSAVQSDLTNAKTAVVAYQTDNNAPPASQTDLGAVTGIAKYGYTKSTNTSSIALTTDSTGVFCILATGTTTNKWYATTNTGVTKGAACPAVASW